MKIRLIILVGLAVAAGLSTEVRGQTTAFTYQGRVQNNGTNFNGLGQFKFAIVTSTNSSHQATATANLSGQFVTSYNLISGGSGYASAPTVAISGGGGSGAAATATISGGVVTAVNPVSAGSGYTSTPTVTLSAPPANITYVTYWSNDGTSSGGSEPTAAVGVAVTNGLFTVALGDATLANMTAISAALFSQPSLQLRIWFNDGVHGSSALSPVQNLTPAPYAVFANNASSAVNATTATVANGVVPNAVTTVSIANSNVTGAKIASGAVVRSLNGLQDALTLAQGNNVTITPSGQTLTIAASGGWTLAGNAGTTPGVNFVGTTDSQPLQLHVGGTRALRLEPNVANGAPNVVGGSMNNLVDTGVFGATIAGGGATNYSWGPLYTTNRVSANFGTVGGGLGNLIQANADESTIAGGFLNMIQNCQYGAIGGGNGNNILDSSHWSTIAGGSGNAIQTSANSATVGGGGGNIIQTGSDHSTIAGGGYSTIAASADSSTIGGGYRNTIQFQARSSTIAGGKMNTNLAGAFAATIGGGLGNVNGGSYSTIGGGEQNTVNSGVQFATIPGGTGNYAAADYSFAGGFAASALHSGAFVWGDHSGPGTGSTAANQFMVRCTGGAILYSSTGNAGVQLVSGGGSWSTLSDRNVKERFIPVDAKAVLEKVAEMPVTTWNYTAQDKSIRHIGPMAQDFYAAFAVGEDSRHITTVDEGGVALAAIQGLNIKLQEKDAEIQALNRRLEKLEQALSISTGNR